MAISSNDFNAPYVTHQVCFGAPQTGVSPTASAFHALFFADKPTDILYVGVNYAAVDAAASQTATVGYATTPATGATATAFGDATDVSGGGAGVKSIKVDLAATTAGQIFRVPAGSWVGITHNSGTVTNAKIAHAVVKYRCPQ
jgi:hypothetical protein